jgi:hypothetical protein
MVLVCAVSGVGGLAGRPARGGRRGAGARPAGRPAALLRRRVGDPRLRRTSRCGTASCPHRSGARRTGRSCACSPSAVSKLRVCDYGPDPGDAKLDVAVVGDSHAAHWIGAFQTIAKREKWHVATLLKGSCPLTTRGARRAGPRRTAAAMWNGAAQQWLAAHPSPVRRRVGELGQPLPDLVRR